MYRNDSPGWAFFDVFMIGLTWFAGYSTGVHATVQEIEKAAMKDDIEELRKVLKEQNRINAMNR